MVVISEYVSGKNDYKCNLDEAAWMTTTTIKKISIEIDEKIIEMVIIITAAHTFEQVPKHMPHPIEPLNISL